MTRAATLSIRDLRFGYGNGQPPILEGLSHDFEQGTVTAVTGRSGRGKSTLLYLLGLLLTPESGSVLIDGDPVSGLSDRARSLMRASSIGMVFQDSVLDPTRTLLDSVTEPVLYAHQPRHLRQARAAELLDAFGVDVPPKRKPGQISGGQAQRVAVARALINDPILILADEPTGNLDPDNARRVWDILNRLAREGRTVVVATHSPELIEEADKVLAL
jgi:putative ABC transport system ATP-binding protein/lipoprotein-releasing system ATP-binding protein